MTKRLTSLLTSAAVMAALSISIAFTPARPASAQTLQEADNGTLVCIIFQRLRLSGNEISFTGVALRNFDPVSTITIDELTIYAGNGDVLKTLINLPVAFKDVLPPNQSTKFNTIEIFGKGLPAPRPSQLVIRWSNDVKGLELFGNTARVDRARTLGSPPTIDQTRSRGNLRCAPVKIRTRPG